MESAIYSNQGDEYQRLIALHWVVRLLYEDELEWVQIEAIASPETQERILIEDIVIGYKDGYKTYSQAKKNQPKHRAWSLADLRDILRKSKKQLTIDPAGKVSLYSRTEFGDLKRLKEAENLYGDFSEFNSNAASPIKAIFNEFKDILDLSNEDAFKILRSIRIEPYHDFSDWERIIKDDLKRHYTQHDRVYDFLIRLITQQSARLNAPCRFTKDSLFKILTEQGFYKAPILEETEIIKQFKVASQIGRNYDTKIGGQKIPRNEVQTILENIKEGKKSILLTSRKGSGKTWVLFEVAEQIEQIDSLGLLFIKGDQFDDIYSEEELIQRLHFEYDPFILVSRLSEYRQVVVIIDSLDALSLARDQKPLKTFLSLIDSFLALENVAIILACRDFDLEYDPQLRNRSWELKIILSSLNFERDVKPILELWKIDIQSMNESQKELLTHPQNLKLYEKLHFKISIASILTEFHIIKSFFEETVEKNNKLGHKAVNALQTMAKNLLKKRSLFMPKLQFNETEEMIRLLSSEGVLIIDSPRDRISFTHQALLDYLMIRSYIMEGKSLLEFILAHPQLPFIRPAIRIFLFYLHSMDNKDFSKEVIRILKDDRVAYHVKRLIVESLSEISPITDIEFNLIKNIHKNFSDLFNRFLQRASIDWFDAMHPELTSSILTNKENDSTKITLLYSLEKWMNIRPDEVIECWKCVLDTSEPLFGPILMMIDKFPHWKTLGIEEILKNLLLLEKQKIQDRWIGRAISKYVDATDKGDKLLWQYITQDVPEDAISYNFFHQYKKGLNCSEHHFYKKDFLTERLKKSTWLLETAINALNDWGSRYEYHNNNNRLNTAFLRDTSWEQKHHDYGHYSADPINEFLGAIHQALIFHAKNKTEWFYEKEPVLRKTQDGATAYFLIYSYLTNPQEYSEQAYEFIMRPEIFFESELSNEIGELIKGIILHLSPGLQETIQKTILEREKPDWETEDEPLWLLKWKYQQLCVIPIIFRLPEAQTFIEKWQDTFGLWPQPPAIHGWGGTIGSPLSMSEVEGLSLNGLLKLFNFYNDDTSRGGWHEQFDHSKGGIDQIAYEFSKCVSKNPQKYFQYIDTLWESVVSKRYLLALLKGVSDHVRYRFGRLQKHNEIEFVEPLLKGETIAEVILEWFDKYPPLIENGYESSEALYAISYIVLRDDLQKRLTDYYEKMSGHSDPEKIEQKIFSRNKTELGENDLTHIGINSVRGHIADGVTTLTGRLLENEKEVPDKLYELLELFAVDPVEAVRIHVAELLPFLEYKKAKKGWYLFKKVFKNAHPALWPFAYKFLYYQYREHFDLVFPVLEQIKQKGKHHGAEVWGLLSALCVLDDLITLESLISQLSEFNQEKAWHGAIKVFVPNLKTPDLRDKCLKGLSALMKTEGFPIKLLGNMEQVFEQIPVSRDELTRDFLDLFIDKIPNDDLHHLDDFFDYLSRISNVYPDWCLEIVEKYLESISDRRPEYMWKVEGLVTTTTIQLLRWADTEDNQQLIERVIKIQDRLLELEWPGIDEALNRAERE